MWCTRLAENTGRKKSPKIAIWAPSHNCRHPVTPAAAMLWYRLLLPRGTYSVPRTPYYALSMGSLSCFSFFVPGDIIQMMHGCKWNIQICCPEVDMSS